MSASIGKTVCAKIVLFYSYCVEKCGHGNANWGKRFEVAPSRTSDNVLVTKHNIVVYIINLHSKEEKLVVGKR